MANVQAHGRSTPLWHEQWPERPWQNPFVESFASRVRDEVLAVEAFDSLLEAQTVIEEWRNIYNHLRPHSSLGWKTPTAYATAWRRT